MIIPGGVDLQRFYPAADKEEMRRHLNIPEEKTVLFTVRDLEPRMGLENLMYAVKQMIEVVPDIYLILGGEGPLKENLISLSQELGVESYIRFVGFIPEEDLPDYYRMADVFVLPTIELEGFGLITLEALASGLPVLGTPVGGTVEILANSIPDISSKTLNQIPWHLRSSRPVSNSGIIPSSGRMSLFDAGPLWRHVIHGRGILIDLKICSGRVWNRK